MPIPFSKSSSDARTTCILSNPFDSQIVSSESAKAFMRKRNRTGAILSPCLTPTSCNISFTLFPIFKTTVRSVYIRLITLHRLGGAPYLSRILIRSWWSAVSKALTKSTNATYVSWSWFRLILRSVLIVNSPSAHPTLGVPPNWNLFPCFWMILKMRSFRIELNIFDITSMSITPRHLLGLDRSPDFGTGTHWLICHPRKSSPSQKRTQ
mmetsp:Transcript_22884/g.52540  ORF Transcript_22884/g.52540 Transcript_22884/m.52540 type:complete len:209 (-) Transcript_22884:166-792(-)